MRYAIAIPLPFERPRHEFQQFARHKFGTRHAPERKVVVSYVLPVRSDRTLPDELIGYLAQLDPRMEVIVVDGSSVRCFEQNAALMPRRVFHVPVDEDLRGHLNGKVGGVVTGLRRATRTHIVIADDDVRYDSESISAIDRALDDADVVRPQNFFSPLPWHAYLDTARTLLNRISGGDWPGTLGVRRTALDLAHGYDGDVLFENLELIRTVVARGGTEISRPDLYVRRLPPSSKHFLSQRIRQAYDEFARPARLTLWLATLPGLIVVSQLGGGRALLAAATLAIALAEIGRRRAHGATIFPFAASLLAPVWILERAICAWLAVLSRVFFGGVVYRGRVLRRAATPLSELRRRLQET